MHNKWGGGSCVGGFCRFSLVVLVFVLHSILSSCQSFIDLQAWPPPYSLPAGSTISINQPLVVAPNAVSIWVQYGKVVKRRDIEESYAHCRFELFTIQSLERTIQPDEVIIKKIVNTTDYVANDVVILASMVDVFGSSDSPMAAIHSTNIYLQSQKQPDLYRLICEHWEDPSSGTYLTIGQIQEALGDIAIFHQTQR